MKIGRYRFIFHVRPIRYMFLKNWYGIRHGPAWVYLPERTATLLDIGSITIGYAK